MLCDTDAGVHQACSSDREQQAWVLPQPEVTGVGTVPCAPQEPSKLSCVVTNFQTFSEPCLSRITQGRGFQKREVVAQLR